MRTAPWIIVGLLCIVALIGAYVWSIQPVAPATSPPGWQTFKQGKLTVVLPPKFIVLDPTLPSANANFTNTYSGTLESLENIANDPLKIEFLAVNLENGDIFMLIDKDNNKNESAVLNQIIMLPSYYLIFVISIKCIQNHFREAALSQSMINWYHLALAKNHNIFKVVMHLD